MSAETTYRCDACGNVIESSGDAGWDSMAYELRDGALRLGDAVGPFVNTPERLDFHRTCLMKLLKEQEDFSDPGPIATEPQYRKERPDDPPPVR